MSDDLEKYEALKDRIDAELEKAGYIGHIRDDMAAARDGIGELVDMVRERDLGIELQDRAFDMLWEADMRAVTIWREAHPDKPLTMPDHTDMVVWLLERADAARNNALEEAAKACDDETGDDVTYGNQYVAEGAIICAARIRALKG